MSRQSRMTQILMEHFNPTMLKVINESHKHKGHASAPESDESHFRITIVSEQFQGLSRIKQHQLVYSALKNELENGLHAIQLTTFIPEN